MSAGPALVESVRRRVVAGDLDRYDAALGHRSSTERGVASPLYPIVLAREPFEQLMVSVLTEAAASSIPVVVHTARDMSFVDVVHVDDELDVSIALTSCRNQGGRCLAGFRTEIARDGRVVVTVVDVAVLIGDVDLADFGPDLPAAEPPEDRARRVGELDVPLDIGPRWADAVGDHQGIHLDDAAARQAGFERAIAHGSYTFAAAAHHLVGHLAGGDGRRLRRIRAGFARPVYPGERLRVEATDVVEGRAGFRVRSRGRAVLRSGRVELGEPDA